MAVCCTKRQCEPDVVNKLLHIALIFAVASPLFVCFVHVAAKATILVTEAHDNCNHLQVLLRAAACSSCKAFIAAAVAADVDVDADATGLCSRR